MGVGAGAVAFHASSGDARHWGRKLDYWVETSDNWAAPVSVNTEQLDFSLEVGQCFMKCNNSLQVISLSTAALTRAVYPKVSAHKTAASLLLTPMQPLAVTSLNAAAMEVCAATLYSSA